MSKSVDDTVNKAKSLYKSCAKSVKEAGPGMLVTTLGHATMELLTSGKPVDKASLILWAEDKISNTASALGRIDIDLDIARSFYDALLIWLSDLPDSSKGD